MVVALVNYVKNIEESLRRGIELINGFQELESPVLIKPNICTINDKTSFAVSDVQVVEALLKLIFENNKHLSVKIVESDSMSKYADEAFEKFGYKNLEEKMQQVGFDVSLINLSKSPMIKSNLEGNYFKNPKFPEILLKPHFFISLAIAKGHNLTTVTGALKNLFGLLPRKDQIFYHSHINDVIVDLNKLIQPDLNIIDARVILEGWNGPILKQLNQFIIGKSAIETDTVMARILGYKPEEIEHISMATGNDYDLLSPEIIDENIHG